MAIKLKQIQGGLQLKTDVDALKSELESYSTVVSDVTTLKSDVATLKGGAEVQGSVDNKVAALKTELTEQIAGKADEVHTHTADEITENEEKQFVSAEKKKQYDDNTIFTTDMLTVNGLGGIAAGTDLNNMPVQDLLTKLLFPYVAPTISASSTPNGGTFEKGKDQSVTNIRATVNKKSEKITKVEVFDGSRSLGFKEGAEVQNGGTFDFPVTETVTANKNFQAKVTDASGKSYTANTGSFNFVYPYYMGVCAESAEINESLVKSLTKKIEGKGDKSHSFTCNYQRMVFAYPKAHGALRSIIDPNNFDVTGTFGRQEVTINGLDGTPQAYYVYVNSPSSVANFNMKFNY